MFPLESRKSNNPRNGVFSLKDKIEWFLPMRCERTFNKMHEVCFKKANQSVTAHLRFLDRK